MSSNRNIETKQAVSNVIKELKNRCNEACNVIENNVETTERITSENIHEKSLSYVRGLHTEIENSNTSITTDENLLTSQFLSEIEAKTCEVKELIAYTQGLIGDVDSEINRINHHIQVAAEALSRPRLGKQEVKQEHIIKAKECFQSFKADLNGLIESLFPDKADAIKEVLGNLMLEKLKGSNGYLTLTRENFSLIELLREKNIVKVNPYNNMEVKLAF